MFLAGKKGFILCGGHQLVHVTCARQIDHHHPAFAIGIGIHHFRMVLQIYIDFGNGPAHGVYRSWRSSWSIQPHRSADQP